MLDAGKRRAGRRRESDGSYLSVVGFAARRVSTVRIEYAIGGRTGSTFGTGTQLASAEVYNPGTDSWSPIAPLPTEISDNYATVAHVGKIFVMGGVNGAAVSNLVQIYDIVSDSWSTGAPMPTARAAAMKAGMTINGLAILCREDNCSGRPVAYDLEKAFAEKIIGGPGSFVITVDSRKSFAEAVRRKLLLEIAMR